MRWPLDSRFGILDRGTDGVDHVVVLVSYRVVGVVINKHNVVQASKHFQVFFALAVDTKAIIAGFDLLERRRFVGIGQLVALVDLSADLGCVNV